MSGHIESNDFGEAHSRWRGCATCRASSSARPQLRVGAVPKDAAKRSFCTAAIELAHGFGVTSGRGVEDVEICGPWSSSAAICAQGFLFRQADGPGELREHDARRSANQ